MASDRPHSTASPTETSWKCLTQLCAPPGRTFRNCSRTTGSGASPQSWSLGKASVSPGLVTSGPRPVVVPFGGTILSGTCVCRPPMSALDDSKGLHLPQGRNSLACHLLPGRPPMPHLSRMVLCGSPKLTLSSLLPLLPAQRSGGRPWSHHPIRASLGPEPNNHQFCHQLGSRVRCDPAALVSAPAGWGGSSATVAMPQTGPPVACADSPLTASAGPESTAGASAA